MATQPAASHKLALRKTTDARAMIRDERLERIVAATVAVATQLARAGLPINYVAVTGEDDPEIEDWTKLSITAWVPNDSSVEGALAANRSLLKNTLQRVSALGPEEARKLSDLVLIGIDIDDE